MKRINRMMQSIWRATLKYYWLRGVNWHYSRMKEKKYPRVLKRRYKKNTGKVLNLENPQTYNEKIQWSKLYDRNPRKTKLADKYAVREWIAETIGEEHLIPLLGVWDSADDIDFDTLPEQFVLKANHGCKWNIIVQDKSKLDMRKTRKQLKQWLRLNIAFSPGLELHYAGIKPYIIAEAYLEDTVIGELLDYKFFCFNGEPHFCTVEIDRFTDHRRNIYDLDWKQQHWELQYPKSEKVVDKPKHFDTMIDIARKLCKGFPHVRVDLYNIDGKIYAGEMTFTHGGGQQAFLPPEYDSVLGELWKTETGH